MTDDPLAHLYADLGEELDLPVVETSLEELVNFADTLAEDLTDADLDELALLVKARVEGPGLPDEEAAALGLGEIRLYDGTPELVVNDVGRAVLKRLADQMSAAEFEDRLRALGVIL